MAARTRITVLTGDIVNSTGLGRENTARAFDALRRAADTQEDWHGAPLHFTRHRGDGWQVVLRRPELSLRSGLAFRAALRRLGRDYDSYFGFATGTVSESIEPDLNEATSPVFSASGHALDAAKARPERRMVYHGGGADAAIATLVDHISQSWTPAQAAAVHHLIAPNKRTTHTDVAEILGKSRQAVTKAADAASLPHLDYALRCIEDLVDD